MRIIGYTYEADVHCVDCTLRRFGATDEGDAHGVPVDARDRDGNSVHPIHDIDEFAAGEHCGDCRVNLII